MHYRISPQVAVLAGIAAGLGSESGLAGPAGEAITFDAVYTGEPIRNLEGGQRTGGTYLDNLDLQVVADRGSIFGVPGLSGLLYVLNNNSSEFSAEYVGDSHVVSNIDAPRGLRLFEAWLDWAPGGGSVSTRIGLYDLNSEFDSIETAGLFLNGAQGMGTDFGQTGLNGRVDRLRQQDARHGPGSLRGMRRVTAGPRPSRAP
jgi:carbohydrate-selective porin OprB